MAPRKGEGAGRGSGIGGRDGRVSRSSRAAQIAHNPDNQAVRVEKNSDKGYSKAALAGSTDDENNHGEADGRTSPSDYRTELSKGNSKPAIHVIVLGPTGGPREDRVTGLLVRSLATKWTPNSMAAVDAGTLLSGIIDVLDESKNENGVLISGPFAGLHLPHQRAEANGVHIFKKIIGSVLITHPHLDHVSALAMNTPILTNGNGPKTVAALPSVINALKTHIFNDLIWPNLSDEDGGVGFITYQRLVEGGNPMMGLGDERGYIQACEGLLTRCLSISHGRCKAETDTEVQCESSRRSSSAWLLPAERRRSSHDSIINSAPNASSPSLLNPDPPWCAFESSAFFLRDQHTGTEIIIFGDVEPDSISLNPRNKLVWEMAAPKIASRQLRAIFIECSYTDATEDVYLFGHLCPRHLAGELGMLATLVAQKRGLAYPAVVKRKRESMSESNVGQPSPKWRAKDNGKSTLTQSGTKRSSSKGVFDNTAESSESKPLVSVDRQPIHCKPSVTRDIPETEKPLSGLSVYIIHVKEDLSDGPHPRETILEELNNHEKTMGLGCEFHTPKRGESIYI
ncbi:cAMP phosphodiesterases class-II-domain-containing protein [Aspergillus varians]